MDRSDHLGQPVKIAAATKADATDWATMRDALRPGGRMAEHQADIASALVEPGDTLNLIARRPDGVAAGFAEASMRRDYVNGCHTSPVGFLEGIYVVPLFRRSGIAGLLVAAVATWARAKGSMELASDADIDNAPSQQMHGALGFEETQRVVYFRKVLGSS